MLGVLQKAHQRPATQPVNCHPVALHSGEPEQRRTQSAPIGWQQPLHTAAQLRAKRDAVPHHAIVRVLRPKSRRSSFCCAAAEGWKCAAVLPGEKPSCAVISQVQGVQVCQVGGNRHVQIQSGAASLRQHRRPAAASPSQALTSSACSRGWLPVMPSGGQRAGMCAARTLQHQQTCGSPCSAAALGLGNTSTSVGMEM